MPARTTAALTCPLRRAVVGAVLAVSALTPPALAGVQCPALNRERGDANTYYALVFVDAASEQERGRLAGQVTPMLNDIARSVARRSNAARALRIKLLACEYQVGGDDFGPEEARLFYGRRVVAVFWKEQDKDQPSLVQLAVPVYVRRADIERHEIEVATAYDGAADNPIDAWIDVFKQQSALYRPFVSMGVANAYRRENEFQSAWVAYCDSRLALVSFAGDKLRRPDRAAIDREISAELVAMMDELRREAATKAGVRNLQDCVVPDSGTTP